MPIVVDKIEIEISSRSNSPEPSRILQALNYLQAAVPVHLGEVEPEAAAALLHDHLGGIWGSVTFAAWYFDGGRCELLSTNPRTPPPPDSFVFQLIRPRQTTSKRRPNTYQLETNEKQTFHTNHPAIIAEKKESKKSARWWSVAVDKRELRRAVT